MIAIAIIIGILILTFLFVSSSVIFFADDIGIKDKKKAKIFNVFVIIKGIICTFIGI